MKEALPHYSYTKWFGWLYAQPRSNIPDDTLDIGAVALTGYLSLSFRFSGYQRGWRLALVGTSANRLVRA